MSDGRSEDCERERVTSGETNMDATNENVEKETPQVVEEDTQEEAEVMTSSEPENTQQTSTQSPETSLDNVHSQSNNTNQQVTIEAGVQETTNNDSVNFTDDISIVQETTNNDSVNFTDDISIVQETTNNDSINLTADISTAQETINNESMNFTDDISSVQEVTNNESMNFTADISSVQEATNNDFMDFTADISLDQFNPQKDITDEDVMHHLDVIEKIDLNPESFGINQSIDRAMQSESSKTDEEEQNKKQEREEITIIDDENTEEQWYKEKLQHKDTLLKHRMSKLARVLTVSYPHYGKWLERIERITSTPICKIDPPRPCSTNKLHGNRWKFACNEKVLEDLQNTDNPSSSSNKNGKVVWRVELVSGSVTGDKTDIPAFVLHAVKIFEDFLQTTIKQPSFQENSDEVSIIEVKKEAGESDDKQEWLWLLVRCNSIDELMLFATGKNISRGTMDRLKQTYEYGAGNNCNVKSFYCKSINKCDDKVNVVTTFLVGAEALEEAVGDLKLQLAPKTNFWSSAAGAWNLVKTVKDMLNLTPKTTLIEIGCGIGVIGLSLASQCREVIGVDTPTEVEEAEMTAELNKIFNVSFIVGTPAEVVTKLNSARDLHNKNRSTFCIINTNTVMGRAIEVMTCLRKLTSLRRIVMITTMTKQSVRAILELARPIEGGLGHPFMPMQACAVDILPNGSYFESVILMERRLMHRLTQPWFIEMLEEESKSMTNSGTLEKIIERNDNVDLQLRKNPLAKFEVGKQLKNKSPAKSGGGSPMKGKAKLKRDHSPEIIELSEKVPKKLEKSGSKPWKQAKKKNWNQNNSSICINPLFEKKVRDNKDQTDLREKLSSGRTEIDLIQKVNESRKILEAAKEQLSGPSPKVDATTAKELKNVLSLVLDQTPRSSSVWDRIAPPENEYKMQRKKDIDNDPLLKDRFIHETRAQDILITMPNKEYLETDEPRPKLTKYHNLPPLDPDIMPLNTANKQSSQKGSFNNKGRQQNQNNSWNKNKNFDRNRWNDAGKRNDDVPNKNRMSSPTREYLAPPEDSPPRRLLSPVRVYQAHESSSYREYSSQKRLISPSRQSASGGRRQMTSPRRPYSPINRTMSPPRRLMDSGRMMSPIRRQLSPQRLTMSPPRRQVSPEMKYGDSSTWYPVRQSTSPVRRQLSPERRRPVSPVSRMSPSKQRDMMLSRRQSPLRQFSPHQMPPRLLSPPRRQQSPPRHQNAPPNRFADDWDIPSRGAFEQGGVWQRSVNERQSTTSGNWPQTSGDDRYRKPSNQDRPWDTRDSSSHGNSWSANPNVKESWQSSENRWSGPSGSGMSSENWNRNKDSRGGHKETQIWEQSIPNDPWNQEDAEDWNDLPEDARDPWGDEDNVGLKERWTNESKSVWRETNKVEPWARSKDNWQNKSQAFPIKIPGQNKINDSRWASQRESLVSNDMNKKSLVSSNWQLNVGSNNWQSQQNYNQSQAQRFVSNMMKNRR